MKSKSHMARERDIINDIEYLVNWAMGINFFQHEEIEWKFFLQNIIEKIDDFSLDDNRAIMEIMSNSYESLRNAKKFYFSSYLKIKFPYVIN